MEDLKILSEITTRYGTRNINELEFKTPEDFAAYKKKHKMRPGTVVKVAGKDKVIDDKPKSDEPKSDEPKSDEPKSDEKKKIKSVRKDTISRRHEDTKETLDDLRDEYQEAKEMGDTEEMKEISRMHSLYKNHSEAQQLALDVIETQGDFNIDKIKEVVAGGPEKTSSEDLNAAVSEVDDLIDEIKSDDDYDMDEVRQLSKLKNRLKRVGEIQQDIKKDDVEELSKITTRYTNRLDEMKVNKNDYSVDFTPEINDIQKSLNDTISKLKDLGKKLDTKATSVFPNYPKDAIHRRKPDTIDGQVYADGTKEFKIEPMIDWLEGNNKYWSPLKFALSKPVKAYPTNSRGKPIELDD